MESALVPTKTRKLGHDVSSDVATIHLMLEVAPRVIHDIFEVTKYAPDLQRFPGAADHWQKLKEGLQKQYSQARVDYKNLCKMVAEHHTLGEQILKFHEEFNSESNIPVQLKIDVYFGKVKKAKELVENWRSTLSALWTVKDADIKGLFSQLLDIIGEKILKSTHDCIEDTKKKRLEQIQIGTKLLSETFEPVLKTRQNIALIKGELESKKLEEQHTSTELDSLKQQIQSESHKLKELEELQQRNAGDFAKEVKELQRLNEQEQRDLKKQRDSILADLAKKFSKDDERMTIQLSEITAKMIAGTTTTKKSWLGLVRESTTASVEHVNDLKSTKNDLLTEKENLKEIYEANSAAISRQYQALIDARNIQMSDPNKEALTQFREEKNAMIAGMNEKVSILQKNIKECKKEITKKTEELENLKKVLASEEATHEDRKKWIDQGIKKCDVEIEDAENAFKAQCEKLGVYGIESALGMVQSIARLNEGMAEDNNQFSRSGAFLDAFTMKFDAMIQEIEDANKKASSQTEFTQERVIKIVKERFSKYDLIIKNCEEGVLNFDTIIETLNETDLLKDELGLVSALAQKSWKATWEKEKKAFEQEIEESTSQVSRTKIKQEMVNMSLRTFMELSNLKESLEILSVSETKAVEN